MAAVSVLGGGPGNECYLAARFNLDPLTGISAPYFQPAIHVLENFTTAPLQVELPA